MLGGIVIFLAVVSLLIAIVGVRIPGESLLPLRRKWLRAFLLGWSLIALAALLRPREASAFAGVALLLMAMFCIAQLVRGACGIRPSSARPGQVATREGGADEY